MNIDDFFAVKPQAFPLDNGNTVYLRRLSAIERLEWFSYLQDRAEKDNRLELALDDQAKLLSMVLADEQGKRLCSSVEEVKVIDAKTLDSLSEEAMYLNGMTTRAEDDAKKA